MHHHAQKRIIEKLCEVFLTAAQEKRPSGVLPLYYREILSEPGMSTDEKNRVAIDLIASMTEGQAAAIYQRLEGISLSYGLDRILV
jgi:dGTP triphosphohydrolase